jgi:hypothetical protein
MHKIAVVPYTGGATGYVAFQLSAALLREERWCAGCRSVGAMERRYGERSRSLSVLEARLLGVRECIRDLNRVYYCHRSIGAVNDAAQQLLLAPGIVADDLQSRRLQLVSHLCQLQNDLSIMTISLGGATAGYALHRKEYKSLPTDKAG